MDLTDATPALSARELLQLRVMNRGSFLGRPVDVLFDARLERVVGLDVSCVDRALRFLPWIACTRTQLGIEVHDTRLLLGNGEAEFYRCEGLSLRRLLHVGPEAGRPVADVDIDARGHVLTAHLRESLRASQRTRRLVAVGAADHLSRAAGEAGTRR